MKKVSWNEIKELKNKPEVRLTWLEDPEAYDLQVVNGPLVSICTLIKGTAEASDFETNYKPAGQDTVELPRDPDTGQLATSSVFVPAGFLQRLHETAFQTSVPGSIHDKRRDNTDVGFGQLKFYDASGTELTGAGPHATCVKTVFTWTPTHDYFILGGWLRQRVDPQTDCFAWVTVQPNGPQPFSFAEGGMDMQFISPQEKVGLDGVTATRLYYSSQDVADLKGIPALAGYPNGTFNTMEVCVHHAAGLQHHMQFAMIIFVPENV